MCGFLLLACTAPDGRLPHADEELDRLRDVLVHRGPDAAGRWTASHGRLALTHRRLKVIDLDGGHQPMSTVDQRFHLVYNGEIYNYRELRRELEALGTTFRTGGDTEVLLAAYARWGPDCVHRLNGMFAFAVWDAAERRLFLARDHVGIKPLYYGCWDGTLYFASEAKAIVADPRVPRHVDPVALDLYFHYGYVPAPRAIWRGMLKLPAAHRLLVDLAGPWRGLPEAERYWDVPLGCDPREPDSEQALLEELAATLGEAVRRQTVSDVPLGAFLSGGVDSSLVVGWLAEHLSVPVRTFSVGYAEPRFDERPHARQIAERYGTVHHEVVLRPEDLELIPELAGAYDEPFADPAALPTAVVSRLAREHVTVVLSGDGGDETHAGYPRYLDARRQRIVDALPLRLRRGALGPLARLAPSWKRRGLFEQATRDAADRYDAMVAEVPWEHRQAVYGETVRERLHAAADPDAGPGAGPWRRALLARAGAAAGTVDRFQYLDLVSYLPEQLLVKMDRASMRVSLEARVPLLDRDAVELAARIPESWRVRDGRPKYLLRRLLAQRMGEAFANRRKQGFRLPEVSWFRAMPREQLERYVLPDPADPWLDRGRLRGFLFDARRGLEFMWPFLMFNAWQRHYRATA